MNAFQRIEIKINGFKSLNQEAGNLLHEQLHFASNSSRDTSELSDMLKSDDDATDLLDKELAAFEEMYETVREIQDDIIQSFAE